MRDRRCRPVEHSDLSFSGAPQLARAFASCYSSTKTRARSEYIMPMVLNKLGAGDGIAMDRETLAEESSGSRSVRFSCLKFQWRSLRRLEWRAPV
jgi:hypothetical protein